jgi:hypothetical protein
MYNFVEKWAVAVPPHKGSVTAPQLHLHAGTDTQVKGTAMSQTNDTFNPFDPAGMFKSVQEAGMEAWSKAMIQLVNSEAYTQATAAMLDAWLTTSALFRKAIETAMTQALISFNMPTRPDVIGVAERLTNIELRLDDLDAKLEEVRRGAGNAAPPNTPPRTPEGQP